MMNRRYEILKAVAANPGATAAEIAAEIGEEAVAKVRDGAKDCAKEGLLSRGLDEVTKQLGYTITDAGKKRLAEGPAKQTGSNLRKAGGDSEGGETDVKATAKPSREIPLVERKQSLAPAIESERVAQLEASNRIRGENCDELRRQLAQKDDEVRNLRALNEKLEHLLQSARNEAEHLRRHASQGGVDMVNHPPHYQGSIECIDAIESALGPDGFRAYCRGTAMKYAWRAGKKGDAAEDMAKGAWYLSRAANTNSKDTQ
jgi:DNA-binding PadR family transcriptional regulator